MCSREVCISVAGYDLLGGIGKAQCVDRKMVYTRNVCFTPRVVVDFVGGVDVRIGT